MNNCVECKTGNATHAGKQLCESKTIRIDIYGRDKQYKGTVVMDSDVFEKIKGLHLSISEHGYVKIQQPRVYNSQRYLHRYVMGNPEGKVIDHINGDRLDNRRSNLRVCEPINNSWNRGQVKGEYKGVHESEHGWIAQITVNYKARHIGSFRTAEEAAIAYNEKAKELHGEYAFQNVIKKPRSEWEKKPLKGRKGITKNSKLTKAEVIKIRQLYKNGDYSQKELGEMFGVSRGTIGDAILKKTWKHVQ